MFLIPTHSEHKLATMMNMDLNFAIANIKKLHDCAIITLKERMIGLHAPLLMREFNQLVDDGIKHFIVDLSAVRIVDADGDYPLLHLLKCVYEVEGTVTLVCPIGNHIRVYYEATHYDTLFEIVETLDMALAKMNIQTESQLTH